MVSSAAASVVVSVVVSSTTTSAATGVAVPENAAVKPKNGPLSIAVPIMPSPSESNVVNVAEPSAAKTTPISTVTPISRLVPQSNNMLTDIVSAPVICTVMSCAVHS